MIIALKATLFFLLLQQLAHRTSVHGLTIPWPWLKKPMVMAACLVLFFILYPRPDFTHDWIPIALWVTGGLLVWVSFHHQPTFTSIPQRKKTPSGLDYYTLNPEPVPAEKPALFFIHGAGNDSLFDNRELFNLWLEQGYQIVALNIPGHGIGATTKLNPPESFQLVLEGFEEILEKESIESCHFTGESLGACFALWIGLNHDSVHRLDLLCPPLSINPSFGGKLWEFVHFFGFQLWWRLKTNTFWQAIPSFSSFKRRQYPVRLPDTIKDPMEAYRQCTDFIGQQLANPEPSRDGLQVNLFHGLFDGVISIRNSLEIRDLLMQKGIKASFTPHQSSAPFH